MSNRGRVKWFDPKKGYGFIIGPEGQDVFVHYSQIQADGFRTLKDGEWVHYELTRGEKGYQARQVLQVSEADGNVADADAAAGPAPQMPPAPDPAQSRAFG
jgi:CspA family cold shock protein